MLKTVLVATDGSDSAMGAIRLAGSLGRREAAPVEVVAVVEPVPFFDAGFIVALPEMEIYGSRRQALLREVHAQVEAGGGGHEWNIHIDQGLPAARIVQRAEEVRADLVLVGRGRRSALDRILGTETALQVVRISHVPVLVVPEHAGDLPRSAAVGVDFSGFGPRAARAALEILRPPGELHLVHVLSGLEFLPGPTGAWRKDYEAEVRRRLEEMGGELENATGAKVSAHLLEGEPAREILKFVEKHQLDLVVCGSHGLSFVARVLLGSVSTRLVRGSAWPVLVVPPVEPVGELRNAEGGEVGRRESQEHPWVTLVARFAAAVVGKRISLEVHDPELGIQVCGRRFPLRGLRFDPRRECLEIQLGEEGVSEAALSHSLARVQALDLLPGTDETPAGLRIELRRGQAILSVHDD